MCNYPPNLALDDAHTNVGRTWRKNLKSLALMYILYKVYT